MAAAKPTKPPVLVDLPEGTPDTSWTVAQLRQCADALELDLGKLRVKAQILDAVLDHIIALADVEDTVLAATNRSLVKAVKDKILDEDLQAGPIAALRILARKIDTEDELRQYALEYNAEHKLKPPPMDNVSIPTFLKYCESLGLTVATTKAAPKGGAGDGVEDKPKSKLVGLRSQFVS